PPCNVPNVLEKALLTAAPQLLKEHMARAEQNHRELETKIAVMNSTMKDKNKMIADLSERLYSLELRFEQRASVPSPHFIDEGSTLEKESLDDIAMREPSTGGCVVQ
ncbi:hypothetical protein FRC16_008894, partial [Serendipita sp. 398]